MNIDQNHGLNQTQQFHRQYGANALLPSIDWAQIFKYSKLNDAQYQALETLYQSAVPLALQVFDELHFDVFEPYAYKPQQFRVLMMVAEGLLNKQIAYELDVSEATIKAHVTAIFRKLGVQNRTQAVLAINALNIEDRKM